MALPGVFGARLTGAGFGGCVVALTEPGALDVDRVPHPGVAGAGRTGRTPRHWFLIGPSSLA